MLDDFLHFIRERKLCPERSRILLATSGGIDSMVMLDLFIKGGYEVGIGHCNFQLRGSEAIQDELLVKKTADRMNVPFYVKRFDTLRYSREQGISIQMAARKLRYEWLEEIREHHAYEFIGTAHHLNDNIETLIINLFRGTGLKGLTGIPVRHGRVIRPLLFAAKDQIIKYAEAQKISFREDQSNLEIKYKRNLIRKEVIPLIEQVNPGFVKTIAKTLDRLNETQKIIDYWLDNYRDRFMQVEGQDVYLDNSFFQNIGSPVLLHEVLRKWGFHYDQSKSIIKDPSESSGARYFSETHVLNVNRKNLIISPCLKSADIVYEWPSENPELNIESGRLKQEIITKGNESKSKDPHIEFFDLAKLKFPLIIRFWRDGDWFIPLGMKGKKKLSDFMIDEKIPVNLKKRLPVLLSGDAIIWIVGYRMDERFKLEPESSRILKITYIPGNDQSV